MGNAGYAFTTLLVVGLILIGHLIETYIIKLHEPTRKEDRYDH